jgi:hypothetical protein
MMMVAAFSACSDEDEKPVEKPEIKTASVKYEVDLGDDMLSVFDVVVTRTGFLGQAETDSLDTQGWSAHYDSIVLPATAVLQVKLAAKTARTIDPNATTLKMGLDRSIYVNSLQMVSSSSSLTLPVDSVDKYVERYDGKIYADTVAINE